MANFTLSSTYGFAKPIMGTFNWDTPANSTFDAIDYQLMNIRDRLLLVMDKVPEAVEGNFASFDDAGQLQDSLYVPLTEKCHYEHLSMSINIASGTVVDSRPWMLLQEGVLVGISGSVKSLTPTGDLVLSLEISRDYGVTWNDMLSQYVVIPYGAYYSYTATFQPTINLSDIGYRDIVRPKLMSASGDADIELTALVKYCSQNDVGVSPSAPPPSAWPSIDVLTCCNDPTDTMKDIYRVTLAGLGGAFAAYNGTHDVQWVSGCLWQMGAVTLECLYLLAWPCTWSVRLELGIFSSKCHVEWLGYVTTESATYDTCATDRCDPSDSSYIMLRDHDDYPDDPLVSPCGPQSPYPCNDSGAGCDGGDCASWATCVVSKIVYS